MLTTTAVAQTAPVGNFHQHLFSPALAALISPAPPAAPFASMDSADLITLLDEAGIRKAVVLSTAYIWSQPSRNVADAGAKVRADNGRLPQPGAGGYGPDVDRAAAEFARAMRRGDRRVKHVWIDVTTIVTPGISAEESGRIATRLRQLGLKRILYGTDAATGGGLTPKAGWAAFRTLPLTDAEFRTIARNVPPYVR